MKKIIKPEDFPIEMNEENIDILAIMKLNYPPPRSAKSHECAVNE
jgi:hypothetical protein